MERLQKVIARSGYTSRRKAEDLITAGKVKVNNKIVTILGTKVTTKDIIHVEGNLIKAEEKVYYVLYKPEGYVSTTNDEFGRKTVLDLVPNMKRVYPVGRLDYDTSGVLLLTNDGDFTNSMTSPKNHVEKEYVVKMAGLLRKEESALLSRGIKLDTYTTKRARIKDVAYNQKNLTTVATITITEGKYHQVKKMFEATGHKVLKLKRVKFGFVTLENMKIGEHRLLKPYELKQLRNLVK
ncbi:MAG: rRNA pseudouridine synthase [Candidatus Izimaplasma sp.]|nr:rRNA pseudouridine synthase [Candidatus Izimaplasma bacterium]